MTNIVVMGRLISATACGRWGQLRVDAGAYRGTYHCEKKDGVWLTEPNRLGDQIIIKTETTK